MHSDACYDRHRNGHSRGRADCDGEPDEHTHCNADAHTEPDAHGDTDRHAETACTGQRPGRRP
jgi:hypothetical protein